MSKNTRTAVGISGLGLAMACVISLIQANGQLAIRFVVALGIAGTIFLFFAMLVFGWHKAPLPIGTPLRAAFLLVFSASVMAAVCWYVWPETLAVYPDQFTFTNPPTPNETFTVTAANRSLRNIYSVQFSLTISEGAANDFSFGIPHESLKVLGQSQDKFRYSADIILFPCEDSTRHPLFLFFIPQLKTLESREITITSLHHSTATGYVKAVFYDENPHSISKADNGDVGFGVRLSSNSDAHNCHMPWEAFLISGDPGDGHFQGPAN